MSFLFHRISTWLIIELTATSTLVALNMIIPALMAFGSYRNVVNFYFASAALSNSLLNCLYIYYLVQTFRSKGLTENNCRTIYYLQTSCTVVLAYTITAMHANFVLCLLSSSSSSSSDHSTRTCLQSCGICLRRFIRRLCFCVVVCVWSVSFTATIPLLYTLDSNEKSPKPVYCPGTSKISYLEELFDRNRLLQSVLFNLIPLLSTLFLSCVALLKLFYDCLYYIYLSIKMSKCSPCRRKSSHHHHHHQQQQGLSIPNSISILSSLGMINNNNNNIPSGLNLAPITESPTPTSETTISSSNFPLQSCGHWCSTSFLRFLLVLSCCLLACIYPMAMRFYLIYFSVLVPLIFAVLNYSLGQITTTTHTRPSIEDQTNPEHYNMNVIPRINSTDTDTGKLIQRNSSFKQEQFELQSPLMTNLIHETDDIDEHEHTFPISPSTSSQSSIPMALPPPTTHSHRQRPPIANKQKYFSNNLYENYNRNTLTR